MKTIVTIPPYAPFLGEVLRHPSTSGIRLNTVMPTKEPLDELVGRLYEAAEKHEKELWIDLKARQLRVKTFGVPPFTEIELSHEIEVNTPVTAYFSDGNESATVLEVYGHKLIMQEGPKRVVGPGESVNIPHHSLKISGSLTKLDVAYIQAAKKVGLHNYMLSFVESEEDVNLLKSLDDKANVLAKIESRRGLDFINKNKPEGYHLMNARGDLYVELRLPHQILRASEDIIRADPDAVVASRILSSLEHSYTPSSADINEVDNLLRIGYKTFMLGDHVCLRKESVISALNVMRAINNDKYGGK